MTYDISRRTALQGAGVGALALFMSSAIPVAAQRPDIPPGDLPHDSALGLAV